MQDIFLFEKEGLSPNGKVKGRFRATGIVPKFADKLKAAGIPLPTVLAGYSVDV
jgi:pilus assembly protein CpaF